MKRAGSMTLFADWLTIKQISKWPFPTTDVEAYCRLAVNKSPSRAQSLLEALSFVDGVFGLGTSRLISPAARGIAISGLKRRREVTKRKTVPVWVLQEWEK